MIAIGKQSKNVNAVVDSHGPVKSEESGIFAGFFNKKAICQVIRCNTQVGVIGL
jgi:hypothetical protein